MNDDTQANAVSTPDNTDTVATQSSEASTQSTNAPEANQGNAVQETAQTDVNAEDTAEGKLYAGKYKTVEEMEKAYESLQSKFGQTTNEKAELSRILNEAFTAPVQVTPPAQTQQTNDYEEADPVNQEIENLKRSSAVQTFIISHPEANATAMQKVLLEDPLVKQISGHDARLEYAFLRTQSMGQAKAIAEAEQKAATATQAKIAEKQAAQVESGKRSEPLDEKSELKQRMSTGSQEQRDAARREYIRKYLV